MYVANKVVIVTGGASGIGLAFVKEFLKAGAKGVSLADVNVQQGTQICKELNEEFGIGKVIFVKTDVTNKNQFETAIKQTIETFKNLDILVNNAGIFDDHSYEKEIQINLNGVLNGCILAMDYISKNKSSTEGLIVNVASILGLESIAMGPVYTATKHGVVGLSKCLGTKFYYDVTKVKIITICPGFTETPLVTGLNENFFLFPYCYPALVKYFQQPEFGMQSIADLAKAINPILNQADNGSFWVIDRDNISSVHLPEIKELKKLQTLKY